MTPLRRFQFLLLILFAAMADAALADDFDDEAPPKVCKFERPNFKDAPGDLPKSKRVADATVNGVKIPAYSLSTDDASQESGISTYKPAEKPLDIKLKQEAVKQLEAYATPMGTILVPKGWTPRTGDEGVDGSFYIVFALDSKN